MKKSILFSITCVALMHANIETQKLDPVVTLATRTESNITNLPAHVEVITKEEIENSGYINTADIFRAPLKTLVGFRGS